MCERGDLTAIGQLDVMTAAHCMMALTGQLDLSGTDCNGVALSVVFICCIKAMILSVLS